MAEIVIPVARTEEAKMVVAKFAAIRNVLSPGLDAGQFLTHTIDCLNRMSRKCDPASAVRAVYNLATIGLIPGEALGHAYFVPFAKNKTNVVQLVIGYQGFLELAFGCNFLRDVHSDVVLAGEEFKFWKNTQGPQIDHQVPLDRDLRFENVVGAYCLYHTVTGGHGIKIVSRMELFSLKAKKGEYSVWATNPIEMSRKTPTRRAAKEWRTTRALAMAIAVDEAADDDRAQPCSLQEEETVIDLDKLDHNGEKK